MNSRLPLLLIFAVTAASAAMVDNDPDLKDLPQVPEGFQITLYARDPLVRNPCSLAFDARGRMFIGAGPQYRNPKPDTPPDSVLLVLDTNQDGTADKTHVFATGFNCIQGLAWHGRDLWVANAPDLTLVRDLDGDDVADEYIRIYTDLGNIEHGLHGLNWAPDGKLYMSKGNSKGQALNVPVKADPDRVAPQPFRELWGVKGPLDAPAFPPPKTFSKATYKSTYHDPADDWGQMGGVLRCDDLGTNLEIVSRGMRNPWDIAFDSSFNWLGTDNDQNQGDRTFMPFYGAHFGWGHPWCIGWTGENEPPVAPISGPVFTGSGTGIVYATSPAFPEAFRNVWIINDWLHKTTHIYRPTWDGALLQPQGGKWETFIQGKDALFRPTDMEFGPDGALYILGWGRGYGLEKDAEGRMSNEGRIFRVSAKAASTAPPPVLKAAVDESSEELIADFNSLLNARRIAAQDELVHRGIKEELVEALKSGGLSQAQETWCAWALTRQGVEVPVPQDASENLILQALRSRNVTEADLQNSEPRLRFAAIQSAHQRQQKELSPVLVRLLTVEKDRLCFYAAWSALSDLMEPKSLRALLTHEHPGPRRAAFIALMNREPLPPTELRQLTEDPDENIRLLVSLAEGNTASQNTTQQPITAYPLARNLRVASGKPYAQGSLRKGERTYVDRRFLFKTVPAMLEGACFIQTANGDDRSVGDDFLSFDLPIETTVYIAHDIRLKSRPNWMSDYKDTDLKVVNNDTTYHLWSKDFPKGSVILGGNADRAEGSARSQYFVILQPRPLSARASLTQADEVSALLPQADPERGAALFHATGAANCATCHRTTDGGTVFGPELTDLGARMETKYIIQSILEPNAAITEGYSSHVVEADGKSWFGILLQENKSELVLGLPGGRSQRVQKKSMTRHDVLPASPMPPMAALLAPQDVADLVAYLRQPVAASGAKPAGLHVEKTGNEWHFLLGENRLASYLMKSPIIRRPGFINVRTTTGAPVTRPFPVQEAPKSGGDHPDMHPGVWLAFGDINGTDFWRNKGHIEHVRFIEEPVVKDGNIHFTALNRFLAPDKTEVCEQTLQARLQPHTQGWKLSLETELWSNDHDLSLGAQEEMGLGVRMASELTEKSGGLVTNSQGDQGAKNAWGKNAAWWDYSGPGGKIGVLLLPSANNSQPSWGHTRDYGVMVANITPREPPQTRTTVKRGQRLKLKFDLLIHESDTPFSAKEAVAELAR